MSAKHFSTKDFTDSLKENKVVAVDFWAEWCGPCRMAEPVMNELADEYQGKAVIGKINIDEEQELTQQYGVMSIPTVIFFRDGKEVERLVGFPGKEAYQAVLDKISK